MFLLDVFFTAYNNNHNGNASNYDKLVLKLLPEKLPTRKSYIL